jgi:hypothetical protein
VGLTAIEIQDRFSYHPPTEKGAQKHKRLTQEFIILAEAIESICPDGREKSLVMTKLEEAKMWASAAVARNPETR